MWLLGKSEIFNNMYYFFHEMNSSLVNGHPRAKNLLNKLEAEPTVKGIFDLEMTLRNTFGEVTQNFTGNFHRCIRFANTEVT